MMYIGVNENESFSFGKVGYLQALIWSDQVGITLQMNACIQVFAICRLLRYDT